MAAFLAPSSTKATNASSKLPIDVGSVFDMFLLPSIFFDSKTSIDLAVRCRSKKNPDLFPQVRALFLVAGAGFEPTTSGL